MKTHFTYCIFLSIFLLLMTSGNAFSQINLDEMNGIHLDYTIKEVEQKIGQQLKPKKVKDGFGGYNLKASVVYKGVPFQLTFITLEPEEGLEYYNLEEIATRFERIKTDLGIRIGSTLKEVQNAYKVYKNKQYFSVQQGPELPDPDDKSIEYYLIHNSESGHLLHFDFKNNKVIEIHIASVDSL